MATRVYLQGEIFGEDATISVFDRGFLYGDSVYEVTRTAGGRPVDLDPHLARLERSAEAILLALPPRAEIARAITRTLEAAANEDSYLRVVATRGSGDIGLDPALSDGTRLLVIVKPLHLPPEEAYRDGVGVALVDVRRNLRRALDPAVKSGNYLNNILAIAEARRRHPGANEAIMCNAEGQITEGSTSNVFVVTRGEIRTPVLADGLLDGITRRRVLSLAGRPVSEGHLHRGDLRDADEAFLTSSIRGVLPVTRVDGRPVGAGRPGPVTIALMERYRRFLEGVASGVAGDGGVG